MAYTLIIRGEKATEADRMAYASRGRGIQGVIDGRQAPGGHAPYNATGHTSMAAAVSPAQAKEHAQWIQEQGLVGVEVQPDGSIKTFSEANKQDYLKARGLADMSNAGAGEYKGQTEQAAARAKNPRSEKETKKMIRAQAEVIARDPAVKEILDRKKTR